MPSIEGDRLPHRFEELAGPGRATARATWDAFFELARIPIAGLGRKDTDELSILAGLVLVSAVCAILVRLSVAEAPAVATNAIA